MAVDRHPAAEQLAEYVENVLEPAEKLAVLRHLADCDECRGIVADTMAALADDAKDVAVPAAAPDPAPVPRPALEPPVRGVVIPFWSRKTVKGVGGLAAAAILFLAAYIARPQWFGVVDVQRSRQALFAALTNESSRPFEGRLTGGFRYAPPPSPTRGPGDRPILLDATIEAAQIEKIYGARTSADDRAIVGIAYLVRGDVDRAIASLQQAAQQAPNRADVHADLSVALIERARRRNIADDWSQAADEADRALALKPDLIEARFNRAVALENLGDRNRALEALTACADQPDGPWQEECRVRRSRVQSEPARD